MTQLPDDRAGGGDDLTAVVTLGEPLRRRLYAYVSSRREPVGRDEAAAAVGVARSVAAFHLDKLAEVGLLAVEFRRPDGRTGPGAGRPAKLYRRAGQEVSVSLPERRYALVARLLADAVARAEADGIAPGEAARLVAREHGLAWGSSVGLRTGRGAKGSLAAVAALLTEAGYEPRTDGQRLVLENCPFHAVAEDQRDLVCGMNNELLTGLLEGLGGSRVHARLAPAPGRCCVEIAAS